MRPLDWSLVGVVVLVGLCFVVTLALLIRELERAATERARLLNAVLARDPREFAALQKVDRKPKVDDDDGDRERVGTMIGLGG